MEDFDRPIECLLQRGAERLTGHQRRLFMAEVTLQLCGGSARRAERRFGWGRDTVKKGLHEYQQGIRCLENFSARGRPRWEEKSAPLAQDLRELAEPHTQADPELKTARRYTNLSAREALEQLQAKKGYAKEDLPSERTMRDMLNRMGYRLKRIQKGRPLKKTAQTDAIFANVQQVREQAKKEPETLEISIDTKAKVNEGDYARGGKNPDRRGRQSGARVGSRSAGEAKMDAVGHLGVGDGSLDADLRFPGDE
jgi:transposase